MSPTGVLFSSQHKYFHTSMGFMCAAPSGVLFSSKHTYVYKSGALQGFIFLIHTNICIKGWVSCVRRPPGFYSPQKYTYYYKSSGFLCAAPSGGFTLLKSKTHIFYKSMPM